jgi:transcriptional regulator with XRE-family HTH domain
MSLTAARLSEAMRKRGWDQKELARRVDATQGAISKILVGKTSNSRLLPKIAAQLGVSLPWLLGQSDNDSTGGGEVGVTLEEREWIELLRALPTADRRATVRLLRLAASGVRASKTVLSREVAG